jgi:PAS domain S-box-containing protein
VASYYLVYKAVIGTGLRKPYDLLFRNLKQSEEELRRAKDLLELKVAERTKEITNTNELLRHELTERRRLEEELLKSHADLERRVQDRTAALAHSEKKIGDILSSITECHFALNKDWIYAQINDQALAYFGMKREAFLGKSYREIFPAEVRSGIADEQYKKVMATQIPTHFEHYSPLVNRWAEVHAYPSEEGLSVYFRDITERKQAEEELKKTASELRTLTEVLEERVKERTEELSRANQELVRSEQRLQHLSARLLEAQEQERRQIAGEIHDSFGASLSAIKFKIEAMQKEIGTKHKDFQNLSSQVQDLIEETRRIQMALRPSVLDDLGIVTALKWFIREFQKTYSHMEVTNGIDVEENQIPESIKTPLFRISQEALNNAAKHSKTKTLNVSLIKRDSYLQLEIRDNGVGFGSEILELKKDSPRGLGLSSMEERASLSGGVFSIHSEVGKGTTVRVSWPLGRSI